MKKLTIAVSDLTEKQDEILAFFGWEGSPLEKNLDTEAAFIEMRKTKNKMYVRINTKVNDSVLQKGKEIEL